MLNFDILVEPFKYSFMINAFIISLIISIPTALLSCFLILKGWALLGDAISHAILPGIMIAFILNIPLLIGAFISGLSCAVLTGYISNNCRLKADTVMGVLFSGFFGIGMILYFFVNTNIHLDHILFGNLLGVESHEMKTIIPISILVSSIIILKWKDFLLYSFDLVQAKASGLKVGVLHYILLSIISLTVVVTLSATGLILAVGLIITPGAIAFLLTRNFLNMLYVSVLVCMFSMCFGTYLSFYIDSSPAPTIILVLTALFSFSFLYKILLIPKSST